MQKHDRYNEQYEHFIILVNSRAEARSSRY